MTPGGDTDAGIIWVAPESISSKSRGFPHHFPSTPDAPRNYDWHNQLLYGMTVMDLRLSPTSLSALRPEAGLPAASGQIKGAQGDGFATAFKTALNAVSQAQNQAGQLQREVQMENPNVSLEETMVAIQKAQIGFQATLHVRNRMVQAYTDIMNMQV